MIKIKVFDKMNEIAGKRLEAMIDDLPAWRREKALKFKFESGRRECTMAYRLLVELLKEEYDWKGDVHFAIGEHGKPTIKGREDIHFNLSHCSKAVACVVSDKEVGIDIECLGRYREGLAQYTMSENELKQIEQADDKDVEFTKLWTMKEAVFKMSGSGIDNNIKQLLERSNDANINTWIESEKGYVVSVAEKRENMNENLGVS